jgi:hypothetical protein
MLKGFKQLKMQKINHNFIKKNEDNPKFLWNVINNQKPMNEQIKV